MFGLYEKMFQTQFSDNDIYVLLWPITLVSNLWIAITDPWGDRMIIARCPRIHSHQAQAECGTRSKGQTFGLSKLQNSTNHLVKKQYNKQENVTTFFLAQQPKSGPGRLIVGVSRSHTSRHKHTRWTPLNE